MKKVNQNIIFTICLLLIGSLGFAQNWQQVWADEFNYTGAPDPNKWGYDVGGGGWGNGEAQYYTNNRRENARVENGNLVIEARRDWSGAEYSSARLVSRGKGDWTYGRIEIRAKIPVGQGLWPAIWMMPTDGAYGGWPQSGEIDIMESFALGGLKYDKVESNIHTKAYNHTIGTNKGGAITGLSNIQDNYHTYRVTWTANKMVFDVDGREYFTFNNEGGWEKWPYDKRFHMILNIAVGGSLGTWIDPNVFPKKMEVDYIRVFQDNGVPPINSSTDVVTTYNDCNYAGFSGGLALGDYNMAKLKTLGVNNDAISSLRITQGYQAILYQDDNFSGGSTVINSDNTCLNTTWNDKVTSIRVIPNGATNLGGEYMLQNRNSGLNMDVWGGSTANGSNIAQANPSSTNINQKFTFTHLGDGLYKIIAKVSGKSLDINSLSKADGANVEQYTYNATGNQKFILVPTGDGYYKIIASHSGKLVEVGAWSTTSGGNVQQWTNANQASGHWKLVAPNTLPTVSITSPSQNASFTSTANITINASASDADGSVSKVEFFNGNTKLGEDLTSPYTYNWNGVSAGNYTITARATDNLGGVSTSSAIAITVSNPVVKSPYGGTRASIPGVIEAERYDIGGQNLAFSDVTPANEGGAFRSDAVDIEATSNGGYNVGWIQNGEWLDYSVVVNTAGNYKIDAQVAATAAGRTFALQVNGVTIGSFSIPNTGGWQNWQTVTLNNIALTAGQKTLRILATSSDFNIDKLTFTAGIIVGNNPPSVSLTSPANNTTYNAPASITINANASDADGNVTKVEFYNGGTKLGEDASAPYSYTWSGVTAGTYTITAKAFDNNNASTTSGSLTVKVNTVVQVNQAPSVNLTSPTNNATYNAPASITINANASDADGNVTKVEFYNGGTKLGEDASAPYSFTWPNVAAGTYTISAKAFDNSGASTTSGSVTVKVNTVVVSDPCSGIANYSENNGYVAGSKVKNAGKQFECKEWPYSGWCNGASWAYAPGVGAYWTDAWYERGTCNARTSADENIVSANTTTEINVAPNPAENLLNLSSELDLSNAQVSVTDITGRVLINTNNSGSSIDVSNLNSGMYTITIITNDNTKSTKRFIKK